MRRYVIQVELIRNFITFFFLPVTLIKAWAVIPIFATSIIKSRTDRITPNEIAYIASVAFCFFGNLILGREHNYNSDTPAFNNVVITVLIYCWLFLIHRLSYDRLGVLVLTFFYAVSVGALFLVIFTFLSDPIVLFSRKFLSPFDGDGQDYIATPGYGNSSGLLLLASFPFLGARGRFVALLISVIVSILLQNRTLMIICFAASLFLLRRLEDYFALLIAIVSMGLIAFFMLPTDLVLGSFDVLVQRLSQEGASSERWTLIPIALADVVSFGHPFGGLDPDEIGHYTYYFHNGVLDSYKNFGMLGFMTSIFILFCLLYRLVRGFSHYKFLLFFGGVSVFMTAVIFEGTVFEAYALLLFFAIFFRKGGCVS